MNKHLYQQRFIAFLCISFFLLGGCNNKKVGKAPSFDEPFQKSISEASRDELLGVVSLFNDRSEQDSIFQAFRNPAAVRSANDRLDSTLNVVFAENEFYDYVGLESDAIALKQLETIRNLKASLKRDTTGKEWQDLEAAIASLKKRRTTPGYYNVTLKHRSYNKGLVGETWHIEAGDSMLINLTNNLPETPLSRYIKDTLELGCTTDHYHVDSLHNKLYTNSPLFENTNLHVHGLHVSPKGSSDNVLLNILPGCDYQYRIAVPKQGNTNPEGNPYAIGHAPGTFWYHSHVHGSTALQVSSGMAGAIIIEGGLDTLTSMKKIKKYDGDRIFMFQQMPYLIDKKDSKKASIPYYSGLKEPTDTLNTFGNNTWNKGNWRTTINGMILPIINMKPKEVQRWRFIHGGIRESINLKVATFKGDSLFADTLYTIAEDGIAYGTRKEANRVLLHPGYRADILVQASQPGDTLFLIDDVSDQLGAITDLNQLLPEYSDYNDQLKEKLRVLAIIIVNDAKAPADMLTAVPSAQTFEGLNPYENLLKDMKSYTPDESMAFNIALGTTYVTTRGGIIDTIPPTSFQVDGVPYDADALPRLLPFNKKQRWTLSSDFGNHPFHIHVNHFKIIERILLDKDGNDSITIEQEYPQWKDTYMVNSNERTVIETAYKDYKGAFVLHCHILQHEDEGMMQKVVIVPPDSIEIYKKMYELGQAIPVCGIPAKKE